jgi:hypothetical protein
LIFWRVTGTVEDEGDEVSVSFLILVGMIFWRVTGTVEDEGDEVSASFLILVGIIRVGPNAAFSGLFVDSDGTFNDDG